MDNYTICYADFFSNSRKVFFRVGKKVPSALLSNVRVPLGGVPKSGISERGTVRGGTETDLEGYPEALGGILKTSKMER